MQLPGRVYEGQPLDDAGFDGGVPQSLTMGTGDGYNNSTTLIYEAENNFTVELWVKPTATHEIDAESQGGFSGVTGQKFVIDPVHDFGGTSIAGMGISVGTNGVSVYEHADGYMFALLVWESPTPLTAWTHVAVVYENKQPRLYINGQLVRTGLQSTRSQVYPGNLVASGQYGTMEGQADEVRVWSTVRTQQQIEENMHTTAAAPQAGLAAYWPLKSSDGTMLKDISGNNHHVQLNSSYGAGNWSTDAAALKSYKGSGYRYGFNGQEHSTEIGDDDYTAEFWEYDSRIGRRWNVDPMATLLPAFSPYSVFANNPINKIDPKGLIATDRYHTTQKGDTYESLSKKYGSSVAELKEWNGYEENNIPVGVKMIIRALGATDGGQTSSQPSTVGGNGYSEDKKGLVEKVNNIAEELTGYYNKMADASTPTQINNVNAMLSRVKKGVESQIPGDPNDLSWIDLGFVWFFESNKGGVDKTNTISFGPDATTTKDLMRQEGVGKATSIAIDRYLIGNTVPVSSTWVFGVKAAFNAVKSGNMATAFLGSYGITVTSSVDTKSNMLILSYTVTNTSGWASFTRFRKDNNGDGVHDGIIPDKERNQSGKINAGGTLKENWHWQQGIPLSWLNWMKPK